MNNGEDVMEPTLRVVVEMRDGKVSVQGNVPNEGCIRVLTEGIICLARQPKQEQSLVVPATTGPLPSLRRLP